MEKMKSKLIYTEKKDTAFMAEALCCELNQDGYNTMTEAITGGRRIRVTKYDWQRMAFGLRICVEVDITTTDGGVLVTYTIVPDTSHMLLINRGYPIMLSEPFATIARLVGVHARPVGDHLEFTRLADRIFMLAENAAYLPCKEKALP